MPPLEVNTLPSSLIRKQNEAHRSPVTYSKVTRLVTSVARFSHRLSEIFLTLKYFILGGEMIEKRKKKNTVVSFKPLICVF